MAKQAEPKLIKILLNCCHGAYSLSEAVYNELGLDWDGCGYYCGQYNRNRADPELIAAVEKIGLKNSSGEYAQLKIIEIPADVNWDIADYDGLEHVAERHRTWR